MPLVFVYGTLKRGFPLHERGLATARFLGPCRTLRPYPMFIAKPFFGPVMLDRPGEGVIVHGELFSVEEAGMPLLDELEDVGSPGSFRSCLAVVAGEAGLRQDAVGFMKTEAWLDPVHAGPIGDYQDRRFVPPWDR